MVRMVYFGSVIIRTSVLLFSTSRGATSSILADYLIEFSNSKTGETESKDKDIMESQRLRREVLPPMWDVYEKSITEKENIMASGKFLLVTMFQRTVY